MPELQGVGVVQGVHDRAVGRRRESPGRRRGRESARVRDGDREQSGDDIERASGVVAKKERRRRRRRIRRVGVAKRVGRSVRGAASPRRGPRPGRDREKRPRRASARPHGAGRGGGARPRRRDRPGRADARGRRPGRREVDARFADRGAPRRARAEERERREGRRGRRGRCGRWNVNRHRFCFAAAAERDVRLRGGIGGAARGPSGTARRPPRRSRRVLRDEARGDTRGGRPRAPGRAGRGQHSDGVFGGRDGVAGKRVAGARVRHRAVARGQVGGDADVSSSAT